MKHLAWALVFLSSPVAAQSVAPANQPPPITPSRSGEDYSYLADPANIIGKWWEPLKHISIGDEVFLSTGLEARLRSEIISNNLWGDAVAPDDGYVWARLLPYADLHAGRVRAFVQLGVVKSSGVEPRPSPIDEGGVDLLQGFFEAKTEGHVALTVRAGRFMLGLGNERLVTTRWGPNAPLSFDGVSGIVNVGDKWRSQLLYVRPVEGGTGDFDDETSESRALWGLYTTRRVLPVGNIATDVDFYYLGYRNRSAAFQSGSGRELRHTLGLRAVGREKGWDWDWEAFYQFGDFDSKDISAWSFAAVTGYTFKTAALKPRVGLSVAVISGDKSSTDQTLETFNPLFPRGRYFGELSPIGPYNLILAQPSTRFSLTPHLGLSFAASTYWRQSRSDGIYSLPGRLLRASGGAAARYIGSEIEATIDWTPSRSISFGASLAAFKAGNFLRATGNHETTGFASVEVMFRY